MKTRFITNAIGQMTVVGLLLIFLAVMVLSALMGTITDEVTNVTTSLNTDGFTTEGTLFNLIPMFIIVVMLSSIALYGGPQT